MTLLKISGGIHMLSKWILVGGGVAVVIAAGWGVYAYFDKEGTKMEVTLCVAPDEHWCPKGAVFLTGSSMGGRSPSHQSLDVVAKWVTQECEKYGTRNAYWREGPVPICNCVLVDVKCSG
jgi:hypothetical protein